MNFFQRFLRIADGAEDAGGDNDVEAVALDVLHVLGEADDEALHVDVRMVGLLLEELLLEKGIDFDDRQLTLGRVKGEIVAGTGSDFQDAQDALLPQLGIGRFVILDHFEMFPLQIPDRVVVDGQHRCVHLRQKPMMPEIRQLL